MNYLEITITEIEEKQFRINENTCQQFYFQIKYEPNIDLKNVPNTQNYITEFIEINGNHYFLQMKILTELSYKFVDKNNNEIKGECLLKQIKSSNDLYECINNKHKVIKFNWTYSNIFFSISEEEFHNMIKIISKTL